MKGGVLFIGLLFFIFSCSEDEPKKNYLYDRCAKCSFGKKKPEDLISGDSIRLVVPPVYGVIDPNIPPKRSGNRIYLKTKNDVVLSYNLNNTDTLQPIGYIQLPSVASIIADFSVLDDSVFHLATNADTNFVYEFDARKNTLREVLTDTDTRWDAMPFMGLTFHRWKNNYVLPFIPMDQFKEGSYLAVYSKDFKLKKTIGSGRDYEGDIRFAPYFDTPIMTNIDRNGAFYVTYSSGEKIIKCRISSDWKINYLTSICFPPTVNHDKTKILRKEDLGNFAQLRKAYNCGRYTARISANDRFVYRMVKLEQEEIDLETRRVYTALQAPWVLEKYDVKKKRFQQKSLEPETFAYSSSFNYDNKEYILTYESLSTENVVFVAF